MAGGSLSGTMPDPETMREYAALFPDAPERLLRIVESQTVDASARADRLVNAEIEASKQGRLAASLLIAVCICSTIILLFQDRLAAAAILLILPAIMVVRSFLDQRPTQE